ncbi:hypothetical protein KKC45_02030 [Patescibacteria group bacterium]|nr:hypothetical protein [Patescibacteria group bacterium]
MAMTEARRNEIAYLYILAKIRREGVSSLNPNNIKRELGNSAKEVGITIEEAMEFTHNLVLPLIKEAFPMPKEENESEDVHIP